MGFLSKLFGSDTKETVPKKTEVEKILDKYANAGDFNSIIRELDNLDFDNLPSEEQEDWYFFRGVSEMRINNRDKALTIFETGFEKIPTSQRLAFSIGQEYEYKGDKDTAIKYFTKVKYSHQTAEFYNRIMQYFYLWSKFDQGIKMIQPILDTIYGLGIIDDTFLHIRELPFFSQIYPAKIVFSYLDNGSVDQDEFIKYKDKFGAEEIEPIENLMKALINKDYEPIIVSTQSILERVRKDKFPSAFQELQIALFQNKKENNLNNGLKRIDKITISDNDFPWLNDVKTLGKAELAGRLGDKQKENELLDKYFETQLLMFEPFISFDFGFVDYQEKIKPLCIERKEKFENK